MIRAALLALLLGLPALAQEPRVKVELDPQGAVTVGTPLTVRLTLLVPTYMPEPPVWPSLQIADAITSLPANESRSTSERIGNATWAGATRVYRIVPQRAADYVLPAGKVTATWADPETNAPKTTDVEVPEIGFSAEVPAGAEGLDPFLAASALKVDAKVEGPGDAPKPGDAVTLTLTTTASGTPSMLLPPLLGTETPPGLRAYPKQPALTDKAGERGDPDTAIRVEAVTYVIEAPGDYNLPGASLSWWNTAKGAVETATTDPVAFSVPVPPGWTAPGEAEAIASHSWIWGLLLAIAAAAVLAAPWLTKALRHWRATRARSEPVLFRALLRTASTGRPAEIRAALHDWQAAAGRTGDPPPEVEQALRSRERALYGPGGAAAPDGSLDAALRAMRKAAQRPAAAAIPALAPLNPTFGSLSERPPDVAICANLANRFGVTRRSEGARVMPSRRRTVLTGARWISSKNPRGRRLR